MLRATLLATQKGGINRALLAGRQVKPSDYSTLVLLPLKCFDGPQFRGCVPVYRLCSGGGGDGDKNKKPPTGFAMSNIGTDFEAATPPGGTSKLGETSTLTGVNVSVGDLQGKDNDESRLSRLKNMTKSYEGPQGKDNEEGRPQGTLYEMVAARQKGKLEPFGKECRGKGESATPEKTIENKSAASRGVGVDEATERITKQLGELMAKLPTKQQTEKFFFRVVAFIYDLSFLAGTWAISFVEKNIIANPTVKAYWKKFHEKMEQAKKE
ncbi:uncharacterized protein LOC111069680 [Drosophila obscura]|uniref:uncharacterized protein LOC111069680 n=1 Tax=Drosophila obscura TaxID=7282 RepID=UPI001BB108F4|nr:uncharacterized protein LOC111069680 [Drosophila obscura]